MTCGLPWSPPTDSTCPPFTCRDAVLYCYDDPKEALGAKFPKCSKVLDGPLFLMKCEGWGRSFRNEDRNMWAVEYLKPVTFLFSNGTLQGIDVDDLY